MLLEIISPEKILFGAKVESVSVPGSDGSFQMLNNHAPIVSTLANGIVKIKGNVKIPKGMDGFFSKINSNEIHLKISSGVLEMKQNKIIILTD